MRRSWPLLPPVASSSLPLHTVASRCLHCLPPCCIPLPTVAFRGPASRGHSWSLVVSLGLYRICSALRVYEAVGENSQVMPRKEMGASQRGTKGNQMGAKWEPKDPKWRPLRSFCLPCCGWTAALLHRTATVKNKFANRRSKRLIERPCKEQERKR